MEARDAGQPGLHEGLGFFRVIGDLAAWSRA